MNFRPAALALAVGFSPVAQAQTATSGPSVISCINEGISASASSRRIAEVSCPAFETGAKFQVGPQRPDGRYPVNAVTQQTVLFLGNVAPRQ